VVKVGLSMFLTFLSEGAAGRSATDMGILAQFRSLHCLVFVAFVSCKKLIFPSIQIIVLLIKMLLN
jgi:hypothetical protein